MRVVLDTNVLVSAHLTAGPPSARLLAATNGTATAIYSSEALDEFERIMVTKFAWDTTTARTCRGGLEATGVVVSLSGKRGWVQADPDDDKFVEAAIVGQASVIVSGDKHLLALVRVQGIAICKPAHFLTLLLGPPPATP